VGQRTLNCAIHGWISVTLYHLWIISFCDLPLLPFLFFFHWFSSHKLKSQISLITWKGIKGALLIASYLIILPPCFHSFETRVSHSLVLCSLFGCFQFNNSVVVSNFKFKIIILNSIHHLSLIWYISSYFSLCFWILRFNKFTIRNSKISLVILELNFDLINKYR